MKSREMYDVESIISATDWLWETQCRGGKGDFQIMGWTTREGRERLSSMETGALSIVGAVMFPTISPTL